MNSWQILAFLGSLVLAAILTGLVRKLAWQWRIIDDPAAAPDRKRHARPTPLIGGLAIIVASNAWWWALSQTDLFHEQMMPTKFLVGLSLASLILAVGGVLDDWRRMTVRQQLFWTTAATIGIIAVGIGVDFITNPFGGLLYLDQIQIRFFTWNQFPYYFTLWADLFTFSWLMGATYTTKILDGLDGLVSGLGVIGGLVIWLLTMLPEVNQPAVGLLALTLAGSCAGFLLWNWHPAKIFLGESGALFIGFMLGSLSIISGGKIATALLVLGLPIIDLLAVILQRKFLLKKSPWRTADRTHLHFRLIDAGLSVRQAVLLLYGLTALFGLSTLYVDGRTKVYTLFGVVVVTVLLLGWMASRIRSKKAS